MVKFKIDDIEYEIPNYISVGDYVKIFKLKDLLSDDYFAAKLINIVTDAPLENLLQSDYQEINYLSSYILSLIPQEKPTFIDRFELDGVHYGFFPKWQELSYAEFVDIDTISTKPEDELLNMLHILAAVMYRPITNQRSQHDFDIEKYDVKSMTIRAELFKKKLDVKYILGAQFFFINFAKRSSSYTQVSSMQKLSIWQKMKIIWILRKVIWNLAFRRSSDGSLSQTELLEMILRSTNKSIKRR